MSLEDVGIVRVRRRCRTNGRLERSEEGSKDGTEESDLLRRDLIEDRDEGTDGLKDVESGFERRVARDGLDERFLVRWF